MTDSGRTTGHYQLTGVLCDADLFRRLRARGQARGPKGIGDFMKALSLVHGRPYEDIRKGGGIWLSEHREDQNLLVAIVDTAHLAATMAMQSGDHLTARQAAEIAIKAAPDEDVPKLDLANSSTAAGDERHRAAAVDAVIGQRDVEGPVPLNERTTGLLSVLDLHRGSGHMG